MITYPDGSDLFYDVDNEIVIDKFQKSGPQKCVGVVWI